MKRIKDWFHNANDIILAIVIVAIAAGVIFWRMNVIMEYPDKVAAERAASSQEASQDNGAATTTDTDTSTDSTADDTSSSEQ